MPFLQRLLPSALLAFALPLAAFAADSITGTVTNGTTNRPSAGDDVTLIRLAQGMQESTHTKTDARGHYTLELPEDGLHLVRVTHQGASYFQPAAAGTTKVDIQVYEAAPKIDGVTTSVEELHVEADANELHVVQVLQVNNQSSPARTQFGPNGFDFYLPPNAHLLRAGAMREGLPVPATASPVGDPGHYAFHFPIRPGETQFGIFYSLPYTGKITIPLRFPSAIETLAVLLPTSMTFAPGSNAPFTKEPVKGQTQTWLAHGVAASQSFEFTVTGTGTIVKEDTAQGEGGPSNASGQPLPETQNTAPGRGLQDPLDPEGNRDPLAKGKWWILGGLALLLAVGAGVLLRKSSVSSTTPTASAPTLPASPQTREALLLQALKEELFALETDRLRDRVPEAEYAETKAALELILRRALSRSESVGKIKITESATAS